MLICGLVSRDASTARPISVTAAANYHRVKDGEPWHGRTFQRDPLSGIIPRV